MAVPGWQVSQMWLGGLESHFVAEALWVLMHINEMGAIKLRQVFHFIKSNQTTSTKCSYVCGRLVWLLVKSHCTQKP